MAIVSAQIGKEHYRTLITSKGGQLLVADEPLAAGGGNAGFSPTELLAGSLAACTSITVRMYADRKGWPLESMEVRIELMQAEDLSSSILREIHFQGPLTENQQERLLEVANKCPVHKLLTQSLRIDTRLNPLLIP